MKPLYDDNASSLAFQMTPETLADAHSDMAFGRSAGLLSQSGNADSELKTRVADGVADDWRKLSRDLGMNTSELLRLTVLVRLYGVDGVATMTRSSIAAAAGEAPEKAHL